MKEVYESFLDVLPKGWSYDRLKDIAKLRDEKSSEASEEENYLELEDLDQGSGKILGRRNTMTVESSTTLFKRGDVLFGKLRPYLEKYYLAEFDGRCTGEILAIEPLRISGAFLRYCVSSPWFIERCNMLAYGAKMPRVNWPTQLALINIPLPPADEQERIVRYLDDACQAIDKAVATKRGQVDVLEKLFLATLSRLVTHGIEHDRVVEASGHEWLGPVAKGWKVEHLKRLVVEPLAYGLSEAAELEDRELPRFIRITDFDQNGKLRDETFRSLPREVAKEAMLKEGDVLFARSGATAGKTFMFSGYQGEACFAGYLVCARTMRWKLLPRFLYHYTKSLPYEAWKRLIFTQTTIPNISAAKYNYLAVPLPSIKEQEAIVEHIDSAQQRAEDLLANIREQIDTLLAYRKSLIHECVTGQRRVPEREPAITAHG